MLFSDVPFAALRQLLLDLGFVEKTAPPTGPLGVPGLVFGHAESDTVFLFRLYRLQDRVSMMDLAGVRFQLDWRGLLSREEFDAALRKASA
jgi:hypothetical protein